MRCVNPPILPNPSAKNYDQTFIRGKCGKCYACLSNRRRDWLFRLQNENLSSLLTIFCTLTYDEDNIPPCGLLRKKDLQDYFKRLRHHEDFTYYAIGEYGTTTHRPHYHFVIFFKSIDTNSSPLDYYNLLCENWHYGFSAPARVTYRRLNYVLHYHTRPKIVNGKQTFQCFSKGMGIDFLNEEMISYLETTGQTTVRDYNGNVYVVPRYYRKKLTQLGRSLDVDWKFDNEFDSNLIRDVFGKEPYQLTVKEKSDFFKHRIYLDKQKLIKYNKQDKYI